jgi:hypothetical protein
VFRTDDGGATWVDITGDLPEDAGSWVIRESWVNPDMLFVGNERGVYLTMDGGSDWIRLEGGLPTVGVRDMNFAYRDQDLVVGTFGRSIWVMDIHALQELTPALLAEDAHLFGVEDARVYNRISTYASFGDQFFTAPNPPYGVTLTYYLRQDLGEDATLTIRRLADDGAAARDGDPAEAGTGDQDSNGTTVARLTGSGRPGLHQLQWDLTLREARPRALGDPTSSAELQAAEPGTYEAQMVVGEETYTRTFRVERGWVEEVPGRVR